MGGFQAWINHKTTSGNQPAVTTTYFLADQIGSTRMGGCPIQALLLGLSGAECGCKLSPNAIKTEEVSGVWTGPVRDILLLPAPFFVYDRRKQMRVELALERVRRSFGLQVYGYAMMPEHVHLLVSEPPGRILSDAIKSLKQGVSRRLIGKAEHFWQKRYYDSNIRNHRQFVEKLRYIHRNLVTRGLCERPEDWEWSSFRQYATGSAGRVEIECEWTARKRERSAGRLHPAIRAPHSSQIQA